jgi:hypothetical protein
MVAQPKLWFQEPSRPELSANRYGSFSPACVAQSHSDSEDMVSFNSVLVADHLSRHFSVWAPSATSFRWLVHAAGFM